MVSAVIIIAQLNGPLIAARALFGQNEIARTGILFDAILAFLAMRIYTRAQNTQL